MVDTISELSELARKLNQKSDKINTLISSINDQLSTLNLGVEVWLDYPLVEGDAVISEDGNGKVISQRRNVTLLGFCKTEPGRWGLAVRDAIDIGLDDENYNFKNLETPLELLRASRELRVVALNEIPGLLDAMKSRAEQLLKTIDAAEHTADRLAGGDIPEKPR